MGMSASMWENLEVEAKEAEPGLLQSRDVESLLLPIPSLNNRSSYGNCLMGRWESLELSSFSTVLRTLLVKGVFILERGLLGSSLSA